MYGSRLDLGALGGIDEVVCEAGVNSLLLNISVDQVDSVRRLATRSGHTVKYVDYDSFGNVTLETEPGFAFPLGFAGGLKDQHTGLVRFGFRITNAPAAAAVVRQGATALGNTLTHGAQKTSATWQTQAPAIVRGAVDAGVEAGIGATIPIGNSVTSTLAEQMGLSRNICMTKKGISIAWSRNYTVRVWQCLRKTDLGLL